MTTTRKPVLTVFDIDCDDTDVVEEMAAGLEVPPEEVAKQIAFAQQIVVNGRNQEITDWQMFTVLLSVMAKLLRRMSAVNQTALFVPLCTHVMQMCAPLGGESDRDIQLAPTNQTIRH